MAIAQWFCKEFQNRVGLLLGLLLVGAGEGAIASSTPDASTPDATLESTTAIAQNSAVSPPTDPTGLPAPAIAPPLHQPIADLQPLASTLDSLAVDPLAESLAPAQLEQVTAVSQLTDILPSDWAYQSLSRLVETYGCIAGYPDGMFRGDRPLTRYEFAAGLNACLDALTEQQGGGVSEADLEAIRQLSETFRTELATLRGRVDTLEARTTELEGNQFSTTFRLNFLSSWNLSQSFASSDVQVEGLPIPNSAPVARFPVRNPFTGQPLVDRVTEDPALTFSHSTYLVLTGSTTGQDTLSTILAMGNGNPPASVFTSAGFASTFGVPYADSNPVVPLASNSVGLFELTYEFPVTDSLRLLVGPRILGFRYFDTNLYTDVLTGASGLNFYQSSLANSGLSGVGAIATWAINPQFTLRAGYLARNDASVTAPLSPLGLGGDGASNPRRGLFNGSNAILAELTYSPSPTANIRLLYSRTRIDSLPPLPTFLTYSIRGVVDDGFGGPLNDVESDNLVLNFDWRVSPRFALFGRYSYSSARLDPINPLIPGGRANVQAFQLGMAFPDLGKEGALATVAATIPYDITAGRRFFVAGYGDGGIQWDLMASYSYPLNDYVAIIPMFFATFNANNFSDNPTVFSAVLRTQFLF